MTLSGRGLRWWHAGTSCCSRPTRRTSGGRIGKGGQRGRGDRRRRLAGWRSAEDCPGGSRGGAGARGGPSTSATRTSQAGGRSRHLGGRQDRHPQQTPTSHKKGVSTAAWAKSGAAAEKTYSDRASCSRIRSTAMDRARRRRRIINIIHRWPQGERVWETIAKHGQVRVCLEMTRSAAWRLVGHNIRGSTAESRCERPGREFERAASVGVREGRATPARLARGGTFKGAECSPMQGCPKPHPRRLRFAAAFRVSDDKQRMYLGRTTTCASTRWRDRSLMGLGFLQPG